MRKRYTEFAPRKLSAALQKRTKHKGSNNKPINNESTTEPPNKKGSIRRYCGGGGERVAGAGKCVSPAKT